MATNYTLDELRDAEAQLAANVNRVTHNGVTTEFRNRQEMIAQIQLMRRELGLPQDEITRTQPRIRRLRFIPWKGLGYW